MLDSSDIDLLTGAAVRTVDDAVVGRVCAVLTDDDGSPVLLGVRAGVLDVQEVLVPASGAELVGREVLVLASSAAVAQAPRLLGTGDLTPKDVAQLERHWGERALYGGSLDVVDAA